MDKMNIQNIFLDIKIFENFSDFRGADLKVLTLTNLPILLYIRVNQLILVLFSQ